MAKKSGEVVEIPFETPSSLESDKLTRRFTKIIGLLSDEDINPQLFDNKANCKVDPRGEQFHDALVSCSP